MIASQLRQQAVRWAVLVVVLMATLTAVLLALRGPPLPPEVAVVGAADSELRVDGQVVAYGAKIREGSRVKATKGSALLLLRGGRSALLREGAAVVITGSGARVELERGRIRLEVRRQHPLPQPFQVDAGLAQVEVLGTVFVVERSSTDERVLVAVQEGQVRVTAQSAHRLLAGGEEATVVRGRLERSRPAAATSLGEAGEAGVLDRLKRRGGRLVDEWWN